MSELSPGRANPEGATMFVVRPRLAWRTKDLNLQRPGRPFKRTPPFRGNVAGCKPLSGCEDLDRQRESHVAS